MSVDLLTGDICINRNETRVLAP